MFIDIHHHKPQKFDYPNLFNADLAQSHAPLLTNFSFGLHPWQIASANPQAYLARLTDLLPSPHMLALGECGLDRCITTPLELQADYFQRQLELNATVNKPVLIHCVRAFNELLALKLKFPDAVWIIHGFNKHPQLARQCIEAGCYLSFGAALLKPDSSASLVLKQIPPERVFFETDDELQLGISQVYAAASTITGLDIASWQQQIYTNYQSVFQS